jgi:hypothetical protein
VKQLSETIDNQYARAEGKQRHCYAWELLFLLFKLLAIFATIVIGILVVLWLLLLLLRFIGFGQLGPIKGTLLSDTIIIFVQSNTDISSCLFVGSFAAHMQRCLFGAAVPKGSWFAKLQRAGMKFVGGLFKFIFGLFKRR